MRSFDGRSAAMVVKRVVNDCSRYPTSLEPNARTLDRIMSQHAVLTVSCQRQVNKRRGRCEHTSCKSVLHPRQVWSVVSHPSSVQEVLRTESHIPTTSGHHVGLPALYRPSTADTWFCHKFSVEVLGRCSVCLIPCLYSNFLGTSALLARPGTCTRTTASVSLPRIGQFGLALSLLTSICSTPWLRIASHFCLSPGSSLERRGLILLELLVIQQLFALVVCLTLMCSVAPCSQSSSTIISECLTSRSYVHPLSFD